MFSVILPIVIKLNLIVAFAVMLSMVLPSVIMEWAVKQSVILPSVIMPNVVASLLL